jgi:hypothetical protein
MIYFTSDRDRATGMRRFLSVPLEAVPEPVYTKTSTHASLGFVWQLPHSVPPLTSLKNILFLLRFQQGELLFLPADKI